MSRKYLSAAKFESSMTATVEMTEIDGQEEGAILQYTDIGKSGRQNETRKLNICIGDLYVTVNALRDYADILDAVIQDWGLIGLQAAEYEVHAARCRKIAEKYSDVIGYNYEKALARCRKCQAKGVREGDTGLDGLEAAVRKKDIEPPKKATESSSEVS